jgi:hypothetical protein
MGAGVLGLESETSRLFEKRWPVFSLSHLNHLANDRLWITSQGDS